MPTEPIGNLQLPPSGADNAVDVLNAAVADAVAMSHGVTSISSAGGTVELTQEQSRAAVIEVAGTLTSDLLVLLHQQGKSRRIIAENGTAGAFAVNFGVNDGAGAAAGDTVEVSQGYRRDLIHDGTNVLDAADDPAAGSLSTEAVQDIVGAMFADSTDLDFTYNDGAGTATATLKAGAITGQTEETTPSDGDYLLLYDASAGALRKMTRGNLLSGLTGGGASFATIDLNSAPYYGSGSPVTTATTGTNSASATTINVSSSTSFSAGQGVYIAGAGAGGANYVGTVQSVPGGTSITVTPAISTTVSAGALVQHDDTDAINAAIAAAVTAKAGRILVAPGFYRCNKGFDGSYNSIIKYPAAPSSSYPVVVIIESKAFSWSFANDVATDTGVIFDTDLTGSGTHPSFIACKAQATVNLDTDFNKVFPVLRGIRCRVPNNPTIHGINFSMAPYALLQQCGVGVDDIDGGIAEPTHGTVGIWLPQWQNHAIVRLTDCAVWGGLDIGVRYSEHAFFDNVLVYKCKSAFQPMQGLRPNWGHVTIEACTRLWDFSLTTSYAHSIDVTINTERYETAGSWVTATSPDFYDPGDVAVGEIRYKYGVFGGTETAKNLTKSGGTHLRLTNLFRPFNDELYVEAPPPPRSEWGFDFTADGAQYRTATHPVTIKQLQAKGTGSVAFAVSRSAASTTFAAATLPLALEAGDTLRVTASGVSTFYAVAVSSDAPTAAFIFDDFRSRRAANLQGRRLPIDQGLGWELNGWTFSISGSRSRARPLGSGALVAVDSGQSNGTVYATVRREAAGTVAVVVRYTDSNNYWRVQWDSSNNVVIKKVEAGVETNAATGTATFTGNLDLVLGVQLVGNDIKAEIGGAIACTATSTFNNTATRHGLWADGVNFYVNNLWMQ